MSFSCSKPNKTIFIAVMRGLNGPSTLTGSVSAVQLNAQWLVRRSLRYNITRTWRTMLRCSLRQQKMKPVKF